MKKQQQKNKEKDHFAKAKVQHKKYFFVNLKRGCQLLAGPDIYAMFPPKQQEAIYKNRFYGIKVLPDKDCYVSPSDLKRWDELVKRALNNSFLSLDEGKVKIPLALQMIEGATLIFHMETFKEDEFPGILKIKQTVPSNVS